MHGNSYDVIVVGGGPAGTMAGAAAAEKGARTLILERDSAFGIPVRCGEGVGIRQLERFFEVDENLIASRIEGLIMYSPDGTAVPVASSDLGLVLERVRFDRWLAEKAARAGAHLRTRSEVDGLVTDNGRVEGVYYCHLGKRCKAEAKIVIAADGVESRVARWAGVATQLRPVDLENAYQFTLAGLKEDLRFCHFFFGNDLAPGGYIWIFPKGDSIANVGIGVSTKLCDGGTAYRKLEEFVAKRYGKVSIVGEAAGGVPVARPLQKQIRDGLIIAGDAARHTNPLTGGGISAALIGGRHAGEIAASAVDRGDTTEKGLKEYQVRVDTDIARPHRRAYRLKEGINKLSDESMDNAAHQLLSLPPEKRTLRNIFLKALASQPKLVIDILKVFM